MKNNNPKNKPESLAGLFLLMAVVAIMWLGFWATVAGMLVFLKWIHHS